MKHIGIIANPKRARAEDTLDHLSTLAKQHDLKLYCMQDEIAARLDVQRVSREELVEQSEVVLALGGDGTVLYTASILLESNVPVLGINLGRLGFLTAVAAEELEQALTLLMQERYQLEKREVVRAHVNQGNQDAIYHALNDVVLGWGGSSRIVTLRLLIDQEEVGLFACDGMILSTPTGSTGHALSNGGPIMHPQLPCMGITFICPHTLSSRPLVIPSESHVRIEIVRSVKSMLLSVDGHDQAQLNEGDHVDIFVAQKPISFIRLADHSYFSTLTQKLNWHGNLL